MSRRLLTVALLALFALFPASCGGEDEETSTSTSAAAEEDGAAAESDVFFGFLRVSESDRKQAGALVHEFEEGAPFAVAGLRPHDVITSVDGVPVANSDELVEVLDGLGETYDAGDKVEVVVVRGSKEETLTVVLGANALLGAQVGNLPGDKTGVLVSAVAKVPEKAGLKEGDVIIELDGTAVEDVNGLFRALGPHAGGDEVSVTVSRGSREVTVPLTLGKRPGT